MNVTYRRLLKDASCQLSDENALQIVDLGGELLLDSRIVFTLVKLSLRLLKLSVVAHELITSRLRL